jgi:hypothetical protein
VIGQYGPMVAPEVGKENGCGNAKTPEIPTRRGEAIGGSSSVNATAAVRAREDD